MRKQTASSLFLSIALALIPGISQAQTPSEPVARFTFDGNVESAVSPAVEGVSHGTPAYVEGLEGRAISTGPQGLVPPLTLDIGAYSLDGGQDFSVQFWVRLDGKGAEAGRTGIPVSVT